MSTDARTDLRRRIRGVLAPIDDAERYTAEIMAMFAGVGYRYQDIDVTCFADSHRQVLRQPWIMASLPAGPAEFATGEPLGIDQPEWTER